MVTTNSDELAERARMLRQHGMRRRYYHDEIGWNTRMDGFQGAILAVKLKYIDGWNQARRTVARRYHALFHAAGLAEAGPYPAHGVVLPHEVPGSQPRLAPVRHPHRPPRRAARVSHRAQDRLGDLLPRPAAHAGGARSAWATPRAASPRPSAPPAKCWPCPSSPSCARTSSRPWSTPLRSF